MVLETRTDPLLPGTGQSPQTDPFPPLWRGESILGTVKCFVARGQVYFGVVIDHDGATGRVAMQVFNRHSDGVHLAKSVPHVSAGREVGWAWPDEVPMPDHMTPPAKGKPHGRFSPGGIDRRVR